MYGGVLFKLTTILDLIAGICMALDFLFPKVGEPAGRWLVRQLPDKHEVLDPLHPKTIRFNVIVTFFVLALIIAWAVAKDAGTSTTPQLWGTIGLFAIGSAMGATLITILALTLNKLGKYIYILKTGSQLSYFMWLIGFAVMILALYLVSSLATKGMIVFITPTATFILTVVILPTAMMSAPSVRQFIDATPRKRVYAIARIGLIIFVTSKIIELTV